ncbi:MAG TPA: HAD-IB family hydrolase [Spirochaetia bacterium]|nr:HAD-IB family hydrolase [Spirochaetia bacterium]
MAGIDFFDVDHTITRHSSGARFVSLAARRGIVPWHLLFVMPWYSFAYRLGVFRPEDFKAGFPYLRGVQRSTLERIAKESFETQLRADIYKDAIALIQDKRRKGRVVTLATSSLDFIVRPLASFLEIETVIATRLEFDGEVCTGRIAGRPLFRKEKKRRVLDYISTQREDPRNCSFYSDSIFDAPLLNAIGQPVAVNPDFRLRRMAREKGWPVLTLS